MACNGIGTPRLLLNSTSPLFPDGLANSSGLVGKCLMHHPAGVVVGVFDEWLGTEDGFPRGSTMLSQEFYETDTGRGFARGYDLQILALGGSPLPTALGGLLGERIPWGEEHHQAFDDRFGHTVGITIMTEDLPEEHNLVTLDPDDTDSNGIPAVKIEYTVSENTNRMLDHGVERAKEVMEAAGAKQILTSRLRRNAGWHLLGTARMGTDPGNSVVDRWGRCHDGAQHVHHRRQHLHHQRLHQPDVHHPGAGAPHRRLPQGRGPRLHPLVYVAAIALRAHSRVPYFVAGVSLGSSRLF